MRTKLTFVAAVTLFACVASSLVTGCASGVRSGKRADPGEKRKGRGGVLTRKGVGTEPHGVDGLSKAAPSEGAREKAPRSEPAPELSQREGERVDADRARRQVPAGVLLSEPNVVVTPPSKPSIAISRQKFIPACQGNQRFITFEVEGADVFWLRRRNVSGKLLGSIGKAPDDRGITSDGKYVVTSEGVRDLVSDRLFQLEGSRDWNWGHPIPKTGLVFAFVRDKDNIITGAVVSDIFTGKIVHRIQPFAFALSDDGALFYELPEHGDGDSSYSDIYRLYQGETKHVSRILTDALWNGGLTDLAALDHEHFFYRVTEEHEARWLNADGTPFFSGGVGHYATDGAIHQNKEQFDLSFSTNRRFAAFAERNWNELTYIVVVDLDRDQRYDLPYFGSFPRFAGPYLLFSSDPAFVNFAPERTDDDLGEEERPHFRQIETWALYAYHVETHRLCKVAQPGHWIQIEAEP